jgi:hypothetical protein
VAHEVRAAYELTERLKNLRFNLLADPYFKDVPSMQPKAKKTAFAFHAKDDLPEVRREVMAVLRDFPGLRFFSIVRDKRKLLEYVRQRNDRDINYQYHPNELYDYLVRRLFRDRLHKSDGYDIYFSKRGKSDRTVALRAALESSRLRFQEKWNILSKAPINIIPATPAESTGLQGTDYFTWALQRCFERGEDRYVEYL